MKNIIKTFILSLALISLVSGDFVQAYEDLQKKHNATRVSSEKFISFSKEAKKEKFDDFWTKENKTFLTEEELNFLNFVEEKIKVGNSLTLKENQYLKSLKSKVIKEKLGEEKYKELEKLIEKRESSTELTMPERKRIYELNKEAM